ncbi:two-component sensor histidine kinase [Paenibacillus marchantiophytorum]|uniref:Heme sensor protein HssS n=1 Tax=Paenibacillus marchantiophytorum TaxID=1619310 RepID=A0ABQ2BTB2_9BACL|nr:HAMP domain-containing sensor histidine kinase [Paenibacillus marchantiophytorum]GGI45344.1 two-component sensor histidine kinase [Paenibacillus marchantiophytorum]
MIKSLYTRVVLTFLAIVVISVLVAFPLATFMFTNRLSAEVQAEMLAMGKQLTTLTEDIQPSNLDAFLSGTNRLNENYSFTLFDDKGHPSTPIMLDRRGLPRIQASEVAAVLAGDIYKSLDYEGSKDPFNRIKVGVPFHIGGKVYALFIHPNISKDVQRQIQKLIIYVLVIVLAVGSLLILIASRYLVNPLKKLTLATERLSRGNFNVHVSVKQKDELGMLAHSFNHMAGELKQLEQMRQDFVSNVSHEIQSPLTSIRGFSKVLRNADLDVSERDHYLVIIERESERLSRLSENLLKLASLESEHHPFKPTTYDLDEQLRRVVVFYEPQWSSKQLDLDLELPRVKITADSDQLSQVWMNLLGNAIKFTPSGGAIRIHLQPLNDRIRISILDTGRGIPAVDLERIFERFYKADAARERETDGSGLGLAIVRKIVELHHGVIEVHSEIDHGTRFSVTIPIMNYPNKK